MCTHFGFNTKEIKKNFKAKNNMRNEQFFLKLRGKVKMKKHKQGKQKIETKVDERNNIQKSCTLAPKSNPNQLI